MLFARSIALAVLSLAASSVADQQVEKRADAGVVTAVLDTMTKVSNEGYTTIESVNGYDGFAKYPLVANSFRRVGSGADRIDSEVSDEPQFDAARSEAINDRLNDFSDSHTKLLNAVIDDRNAALMSPYVSNYESALTDEKSSMDRMTKSLVALLDSSVSSEAQSTLDDLNELIGNAVSEYTY